jgi:hypothetical protein
MRYLSVKKTTPVSGLPRSRGYIMWEGASVLDGSPIAVIATMATSNAKTGDMVQTWIIRTDINPVEATKTGQDSAICGNCPHRHYNKGACYVNVGQAPNAVYKGYKRGIYPTFDLAQHGHHFSGRKIRLGAYGDPAAAPFAAMASIALLGTGHTGYTHQANHPNFDTQFYSLCMVSADTPKQALKYQNLGAKTFRVAMAGDALFDSEIECLSDSKGIQCIDCGLCDGSTKNIAITVHGSRSSNFKSNLIEAVQL